jgi:microcystin-dependent protein
MDEVRTWAYGPPPGSIIAWSGAEIPAGWLECDGSSHRRVAFSDLYAVIGTTFGGTTSTFNVPDMRPVNLPGQSPALRWIIKT